MFPNRIRIPGTLTEVLKQLKGKTGVTPNILCRIALVLSLRDGQKELHTDQALDGLEFNSSTLFGENLRLFECLLRQLYGELDPGRTEQLLALHIVDGIGHLRGSRSIVELTDLR